MFTLLLDLDDTLLDTNIQAFAPAYFAALSEALAQDVPQHLLVPALLEGTKAMTQNEDPALTLREVFDAYFFPKIGRERAALQTKIDRFYEEVFPTLERVVKRRPEAVDFVEWALQAGYQVAIATNPYFPLQAIHHRLRWAGLPPEEYSFALISAYETFHFTKENPAYFYEFLAQLGWPEGPVLMVGNDFEMDLAPALRAGLPVFWLRQTPSSEHLDVPQGYFEDLRDYLERTDPQTLQPTFQTPEALLAMLRSTPAALTTLTDSLPSEFWQCRPAPGEWCLVEVLCHLRDVEAEVNLPRLQKVLAEENPFLPGVVTDTWAEERNYASQDGHRALVEFVASRRRLIALLNAATDGWLRPARHAIFGPTTLFELVGFIAEHDRNHVRQIWNLFPKRSSK
ncbi:MAG: DinB family protein [Anaerolineales bacterium]|nr:DinB family protein [Anaerolineales bacterium]MDW8227253.1 DinB family protein [Anaerolineales bacterium]